MTVIALAFGAYFLRNYVVLIAVAAVLAYLFAPVYSRLRTRFNTGISATLTLLASVAVVGIPLSGVIVLAVLQISEMVTGYRPLARPERPDAPRRRDCSARSTNCWPRSRSCDITLTPDSVRDTIAKVGQNAGQIALGFARDSVGSLAGT